MPPAHVGLRGKASPRHEPEAEEDHTNSHCGDQFDAEPHPGYHACEKGVEKLPHCDVDLRTSEVLVQTQGVEARPADVPADARRMVPFEVARGQFNKQQGCADSCEKRVTLAQVPIDSVALGGSLRTELLAEVQVLFNSHHEQRSHFEAQVVEKINALESATARLHVSASLANEAAIDKIEIIMGKVVADLANRAHPSEWGAKVNAGVLGGDDLAATGASGGSRSSLDVHHDMFIFGRKEHVVPARVVAEPLEMLAASLEESNGTMQRILAEGLADHKASLHSQLRVLGESVGADIEENRLRTIRISIDGLHGRFEGLGVAINHQIEDLRGELSSTLSAVKAFPALTQDVSTQFSIIADIFGKDLEAERKDASQGRAKTCKSISEIQSKLDCLEKVLSGHDKLFHDFANESRTHHIAAIQHAFEDQHCKFDRLLTDQLLALPSDGAQVPEVMAQLLDNLQEGFKADLDSRLHSSETHLDQCTSSMLEKLGLIASIMQGLLGGGRDAEHIGKADGALRNAKGGKGGRR